MAGPLTGLKVLEFIRVPPGAFCTMMLADMGAEVLKIETPRPGAAATPQAQAAAERRTAFQFVNRGKRSIAIDLKQPAGQELLHRLAADADVLVEGFRPGVMKRLGGDYETLKTVNPRLIYCSLSGFGQDGPYRDTPAHDINFLSIAGVLNLIGEPDRPPAIPLNLIADYAGASMHGLVGILLAVLARQRTGRGQFVDVSYLDSTLALLAATPALQAFLSAGVDSAAATGCRAVRSRTTPSTRPPAAEPWPSAARNRNTGRPSATGSGCLSSARPMATRHRQDACRRTRSQPPRQRCKGFSGRKRGTSGWRFSATARPAWRP